jgi:hypothetical protein
MNTIDKFGVVSGCLNISISQAIWLGSKSGSEETWCEEFEIKWETKECLQAFWNNFYQKSGRHGFT